MTKGERAFEPTHKEQIMNEMINKGNHYNKGTDKT